MAQGYKVHHIFDYIRAHAAYSNDPVTKTAAVAVCGKGDLRALRANRINHGAPATLSREARLELSFHAEREVLAECDNANVQPRTIFTTGTPCYDCVERMANAGVTKIIVDADEDPFRDRLDDPAYAFPEAFALAEERGIELIRCSVINDPDIARSLVGTS